MISSKYNYDKESLVVKTKGFRWGLVKLVIRVLGVQSELDKAIVEHNNMATRRGKWQGLDQAINLINTYDKSTIKKSDIYRDLMILRPK